MKVDATAIVQPSAKRARSTPRRGRTRGTRRTPRLRRPSRALCPTSPPRTYHALDSGSDPGLEVLMKRVAIVGGARIPFARANTAYNEASNQDMLTAALTSLVSKFDLKNQKVGEVAAGAGIKHPPRRNLTREST